MHLSKLWKSENRAIETLEDGWVAVPKQPDTATCKPTVSILVYGSVRGKEEEVTDIIEDALEDKLTVDRQMQEPNVGILLYDVPSRLTPATVLKKIDDMKSKVVELIYACQILIHFVLFGCALDFYGKRCTSLLMDIIHISLWIQLQFHNDARAKHDSLLRTSPGVLSATLALIIHAFLRMRCMFYT